MEVASKSVLREVKGEMPDNLQRFGRALDRLEEAGNTLAAHFERMGRFGAEEKTGEGDRPMPSGYLGDLAVRLDRLENHVSKIESLCELAEGIG